MSGLNESNIESLVVLGHSSGNVKLFFVSQVAPALLPKPFLDHFVNSHFALVCKRNVLSFRIGGCISVSQFNIAGVKSLEPALHLIVDKQSEIFDPNIGETNQPLRGHHDLVSDDAVLDISLLLEIELNIIGVVHWV